MNPVLALVITVALLAGNAFFVGAEFAVTSSRRSRLEPLAERGDARARTALWALEHVSRILATAQLGVTLCSTTLGMVAEPAVAHLLEAPLHAVGVGQAGAHAVAVVIALLIVVFLHVVAGEMVPKNISISSPEQAVRLLAPPLVLLSRVFGPVITVLNGFANWQLRLAGIEPRDEVSAAFTAQEVASIVERSTAEGVLVDDTGLLSGALEFSEETAGSVMVPLDRLVTLPQTCTPEEVEQQVARTGFSRFPVVAASGAESGTAGVTEPGAADGANPGVSGGAEPVLTGYLHLKDILFADGNERTSPVPSWLTRALVPVRPDDEVEDVLVAMQRTGTHLGRVEDKSGRTLGVVFLEDILEELVGEVHDAMQRGEFQRRPQS